ncbi:MAG TPA: class I SAM-dependent methyltransferase [Bryobacteraceae bacterium]|nr:class I SAM-dependent methyltransferase [Bryobacteraceae bacterium]
MQTTLVLIGLSVASAVFPLAGQGLSVPDRPQPNKLAPFVVSPQPIVDRMLNIAGVKTGETVFDLGCGDGRILITAAQRFKAKGVGVEISNKLVQSTNDQIRRLNLQDEIKVIHGNLLDVNLQQADVVTLYLETASNDLLRPNLEKQLRPGTRVVSHDFAVRGWKPNKVEKIESFNRHHTIYLYTMPPLK